MYTISNDNLEVQISDLGAEFMSVKSKRNGVEYLWQGDKTYWGGRAYNLFPICGRLTQGKYVYKNKEYEMNLHGFLRKSVLTAEASNHAAVAFCFKSDEQTRSMYPFDFCYRISYALVGRDILISVTVKNCSSEPMYFALGGHPGFNAPLEKGVFEDCYLQFEKSDNLKAIDFSDTCYALRTKREFKLEKGNILKLSHSLFDNDAIVLEGAYGSVALRSAKDDKAVVVKFPAAMKYLGLWHAPKTDAPYVCIEPWTSLPSFDGEVDNLETKHEMFALAPKEEYCLDWSIEII